MTTRITNLLILLSSSNRLHTSVRLIEATIPQPRNVDPIHCLRLLLEVSSNSRYAGLLTCRESLKGGAARQTLTSFTLVTMQPRKRNSTYIIIPLKPSRVTPPHSQVPYP